MELGCLLMLIESARVSLRGREVGVEGRYEKEGGDWGRRAVVAQADVTLTITNSYACPGGVTRPLLARPPPWRLCLPPTAYQPTTPPLSLLHE